MDFWLFNHQIVFTYLTNAKEEQQELDAALQEVKSKIDTSGMSDEEIVLAYHEYLTSTVAYAYEDYFNGTIAANHGYDMYGAWLNIVVCVRDMPRLCFIC